MAKVTKAEILAKKAKALQDNVNGTKADLKKSGALFVDESDVGARFLAADKKLERVSKKEDGMSA